MKEASWNDCINYNSSVKVSPDIGRAKSLAETAQERINLIKEINEKNCNFVFEDYYTSILEYLQSLILLNGYKILNHICLGYYLRDVLKNENLFRTFDDLRYKRNSLTYYGKKMDSETAKVSIEKCRKFIMEIKKELMFN